MGGRTLPLLDDALLDMSVEELQPKIVSQTELFGIALEKKSLKKILTHQEAETKIEAVNFQIESLKSSYEESSLKRQKEYEESIQRVREKESFAKQEIEVFQSEIEEIQMRWKHLDVEYSQSVQKIEDAFRVEKKRVENEIESLYMEIQNNLEFIQGLHKELHKKKIALQNRIEELKEYHEERVQEESLKLKLLLAQEQEEINAKIANEEEKKFNITKNERVKELEVSLEGIEKERSESSLAKEFLIEYEKCKEEISQLYKRRTF
ncbi:MAG: hypothetical protein Q9M40_05565 [Sulfurimonas sp.]|nr:hypothetical protein [Sulfurimonas sp.]